VPLFALAAALITVVVWLALAYRHIAGDLESSEKRLPKSVFATLAPRGSVLDEPQITAAIVLDRRLGAAPILFRSDPDRRVIGLLSLPIVYRDEGQSVLVKHLKDLIGADINHVLVLSPAALGSVVDAIGPIAVRNPRPADYVDAKGGWHFPAGYITLDSTRALAFLNGTSETTPNARAQLLLEGIVGDLMARSTVSELRHALDALASSAATDLTAQDLLGIAWLRFQSESLLRCEVASRDEARTPVTTAALRAFLGQRVADANSTAPACSATPLHPSSIPLPPTGVVTAVRAVYPHLWQIALGVFVAFLVFAGMVSVGPGRLWIYVKGVRPHGRTGAASGRKRTLGLAYALRSAAGAGWRWIELNRRDIYLYAFAIAAAVATALLIVASAV
jgi:hypothetical protein